MEIPKHLPTVGQHVPAGLEIAHVAVQVRGPGEGLVEVLTSIRVPPALLFVKVLCCITKETALLGTCIPPALVEVTQLLSVKLQLLNVAVYAVLPPA
jgi:hypothetical protein